MRLSSVCFCTAFLFHKYLCPHLKLLLGLDICGKMSRAGPAW